jgi:hypothetical protein
VPVLTGICPRKFSFKDLIPLRFHPKWTCGAWAVSYHLLLNVSLLPRRSSSRYFLSVFVRSKTLRSQSVSSGDLRESNDLECQRSSISQSTSSVQRSETLHTTMFDLSSTRSSGCVTAERRRISEVQSQAYDGDIVFAALLSQIAM